jgi:hypothetical protein
MAERKTCVYQIQRDKTRHVVDLTILSVVPNFTHTILPPEYDGKTNGVAFLTAVT